MRRDLRFAMLLSDEERKALQRLAEFERLPASAVVRRLIWYEAKRYGLLGRPGTGEEQNNER